MRAGIAVVINGQTDMELVAQASNGHEATECYREHEPDVTLMDLTLSDMSGIEAMIAIRARFPEARVIISSTFAGSVQIKRAMAAGARSYIIKNMSAIEVVAANPQGSCGEEAYSHGSGDSSGRASRRGGVVRARIERDAVRINKPADYVHWRSRSRENGGQTHSIPAGADCRLRRL